MRESDSELPLGEKAQLARGPTPHPRLETAGLRSGLRQFGRDLSSVIVSDVGI